MPLTGEGFPATVFLEQVIHDPNDRGVLRYPGAFGPQPVVKLPDHWALRFGIGGQVVDRALDVEGGIEAFDRWQRDARDLCGDRSALARAASFKGAALEGEALMSARSKNLYPIARQSFACKR